jgi:pilus assembly protein CpaE
MALLAKLSALAGRGTDEGPVVETGDAAPVRVTLILDAATARAADLARIALPGAEIRSFDGTLAAFAANAPLLRRTDMLVVEVDPDNIVALAALEEFAAGPGARLAVVAAAHDLTVSATRRLLRSSIADVLPVPPA